MRTFIAVLCLSFTAGRALAGGCDQARFAENAGETYKATATETVKAGSDVVVLCDEEKYRFDADGKAVHTVYLSYKVLSQRGAEGWDVLSAFWRPWNEDEPQIRARVITPDGVGHTLDPKTLVDGPVGEDSEKVYSDRRVIRGPLPAIAPGSVVEEETIIEERAPLFGAGTVSVDFFGRNVPVQQSRLILDAPEELPLNYRTHLLAGEGKRSVSDGRVKVVFEQDGSEELENAEKYLPSEVFAYPEVVFATGSSWQKVAESYGKVVEQQMEGKDVEGEVKRLIAGKTSREEKASAILGFLSREIRYTGVEFGESAIVPHKPSQTLHEKYGDCKDKSTLLVAMLRAAGIPAYVALLNAARREDVEPDLPGMGLFDHAIVYAPGEPDFWIDATDEYARLGQLPPGDQGRLSLIARGESKALTRIPEGSSQDNRIVETREFYLAEFGPAKVVETTEAHGVFESEYRSFYADQDGKESTKNLADYVKVQYLAEKVSRLERSDPDDLSKQFRLTLEADKAKRGQTDLESSAVGIRLESIFQKLPEELQERQPETGKSAESKDKPKKPRTADYQLPEAFVTEWHYRIVPPVGFQPKPLPEGKKIALGPSILAEEYHVEKDGTVTAMLRFDTVKRRMTLAEATEMRSRVADLREGQPIIIYFEPKAAALLSQGKIREASQATRELIAKHPKEALHHLQRAKALLGQGMGQAARDEAALAVKLEPRSALAHKTQAEILEHDLVGREHRRGSDNAGSEAAYREARTLDPEDKSITERLALLLEYNDEGERYGPGAKLKEATAEYRSLPAEELNSSGLKNNPAFTMFYSGQLAEAKKYGESVNPQLNSVIVAVEGAVNGTQAAVSEARRRVEGEENLKAILKTAGEMLMRSGKYAAAADLIEAGSSGNNAGNSLALASLLRKTKLRNELKSEQTPSGLIRNFFVLMGEARLTSESLFALSSKNAQEVMRKSDPEELKKAEQEGRQMRSIFSRSGLPADVLLDLTLELIQVSSEGNDEVGYKTTMRAPGERNLTLYVVKEDGKYKILDTPEKPNALALEVMDRLKNNNLAGARALLDWVRDDQHVGGGDDSLAGLAFPRIWTKGKEADAEGMKLAAAALLAQTKQTAREAVPILEAARASAHGEAEKLNSALALLEAYRNLDDYEKCETVAAELAKQYTDSKRLFWDRQFALKGLQRFTEADRLAEEMLKRLPNDRDAMRALVSSATAREDYALAHELGKKLAATGKAEATDLNSIAWSALFTGKITEEDVEFANKAVQMSQNSVPELHTQGCIYAEIGKVKEAREVLIQAMDNLSLEEPRGEYAYAFGRIAEQYGEAEVAVSDYRKVERPKQAIYIPDSSYRLSQMRLKAMGKGGSD